MFSLFETGMISDKVYNQLSYVVEIKQKTYALAKIFRSPRSSFSMNVSITWFKGGPVRSMTADNGKTGRISLRTMMAL